MGRTAYTSFITYATAYVKYYDPIEYDALQCDV